MAQVSINIANRTYELACGEGEEERVLRAADCPVLTVRPPVQMP